MNDSGRGSKYIRDCGVKLTVLNMGNFGTLAFKRSRATLFVSLDGLSGRKVQIDTSGKCQGVYLPKIEHWVSDCQYVDISGG